MNWIPGNYGHTTAQADRCTLLIVYPVFAGYQWCIQRGDNFIARDNIVYATRSHAQKTAEAAYSNLGESGNA